jgi:hypothetical protein
MMATAVSRSAARTADELEALAKRIDGRVLVNETVEAET